MKFLSIACLALAIGSPALADTITINALNNSTTATVSFNDGSGPSSISTLLSQFNVTLSGAGGPVTFNTFSIDLSHTVVSGQTYTVSPRGDLASAFVNGARMAFIFTQFGQQNLTGDPVQAAAVQISLWDLSLNNHAPTTFTLDADGSYSSGDENVFAVLFGANPNASQIAALTNQYLQSSIGAVTSGAWLRSEPRAEHAATRPRAGVSDSDRDGPAVRCGPAPLGLPGAEQARSGPLRVDRLKEP
jgi:hypothetical protein